MALAVALSGLAGFVDALGFITLGGFFVSFMSGNLTRFSVGFADGAWAHVATAGGVILTFVVGVVLGAVVGHRFDHDRRSRKFAMLTTVSVLLNVGSIAASTGMTAIGVGAMVPAMGAENGLPARRRSHHRPHLHDKALVKMGQRLAGAFKGGPRWTWLRYFALVVGLVAGAAIGALAVCAVALSVEVKVLPAQPNVTPARPN
ncbi:YoaK family protein [Rhodococcus sp. NPDC058521]|uniref:YoaK family protein n=1 Tax=Rhodococcus sp. NPDC058521 TaxID=3346536 RepID=UPI0036504612